ncbi:MAG: hypothetical protein ACREBU_24180, partial [Nitrososphaera sp.]
DGIVITSEDQFANIDPFRAEMVSVSVFSDAHPNFGAIELRETGADTSVFTGSLNLGSEELALQVEPGDAIRVISRDQVATAAIDGLRDISKKTIVSGIPYVFTIDNTQSHDINDVDYRVKLDFDDNYRIVSIDKGSFSSASIESSDTILFHAVSLHVNQQMTGVASVMFEDGGMANVSRTLLLDITMRIGAEPVVTHQFNAEASVLESISSIIEIALGAFDFGWSVYERVVPCLSMDAIPDGSQSRFSDQTNKVSYPLKVENCSEHHPELIEISVPSELPQEALPKFNPQHFDVPSKSIKNSELFFILPTTTTSGHPFDVRATALLCIFSNCYTMSYSEASAVLVPEFPGSIVIAAISITMSIVLLTRS